MDQNSAQSESQAGTGENALDLRFYWNLFKKRIWIILVVAGVMPAIAVAVTLHKPRLYEATATVIVDPQAPKVLGGQSVEVVQLGSGNEWVNSEYYNTQVEILTSRWLARRTVEKYALHKDTRLMPAAAGILEEDAIDRAAEALQGRVRVSLRKESRVFAISVVDGNPKLAADLANYVADVYTEQNLDTKHEATTKATTSVVQSLDEKRTQLDVADTALYTFRKENNILSVSLEDQQSRLSKDLASFGAKLTETAQARMELESRRKAIGALGSPSTDGETELPIVYALAEPSIEKLRQAYLDERIKLGALEDKYGPKWPAIELQRRRVDKLDADLQAEVKAVLRSMDAQLKALRDSEGKFATELTRLTDEALALNKKEIDYKRLAFDAATAEESYSKLLVRLNDTGLQAKDAANNIRPLDSALAPVSPVSPSLRTAAAIGGGLGILLAFGLAFLIELLDRSVKGQEDVESIIKLPFLGLVPSIDNDAAARAAGNDMHVFKHPNSTVAECCRVVRTNIMFCSPDKPLRSILVTSPSPVDGKTMTVINLGMVMAQSGKRTLIVNTDMRRPRLHKALRMTNENGISRLILGETEIEAAVKETEVKNLFLLPCGPIPPNPAELLQTEKFVSLIARLLSRYDRVIFDSPPVLAVTDAAVLARLVNGTILIARAGKTSRDAVLRAKQALTSVNAHITGVVLNDVNLRSPHYASYYNYYHYQYSDAPAQPPSSSSA